MKKTLTTLALASALLPGVLSAEMTTEEIAKATQNPLTAMYSLPIQNNTYYNRKSDGKHKNIANLQPVLPFDLSDNWTLVTRTIIPVVSAPSGVAGLPDNAGNYDRKNGIGDTTLTGFFTPKSTGDSGITWGVGPSFYLPTATDQELGTDKWGAGISAVALAIHGKWVYGALASNVWSFGGPGQSAGIETVNALTLQPFVNYNIDKGWFLASVPIITANWEAEQNKNRWTIPLGMGFGKAGKMGKIPFTWQVHGYYNIETPEDYGERWQTRVQVQWLFPVKQAK